MNYQIKILGLTLSKLRDSCSRFLIHLVYPFDKVKDAYEYSEAGHSTGKIVISNSDSNRKNLSADTLRC